MSKIVGIKLENKIKLSISISESIGLNDEKSIDNLMRKIIGHLMISFKDKSINFIKSFSIIMEESYKVDKFEGNRD